MGGSGWVRVLAGLLLISAAVGVHDTAAAGRVRVLLAEKDGEGSRSGQTSRVSPVEGGPSSPNSVPKSFPPPSNTTGPPPASPSPLNHPSASQKAPPLKPVSGDVSNPKPTSGSPSVPASGGPSHPPPAPGGKVNPSLSASGSPSKKPPPPADPSHTPPAAGEGAIPPPASGKYPSPVETKRPKPAPSEHREGTPTNRKDEKEKDKKKQTGNSSAADGSPEKGQEGDKCNASTPIRCQVDGLVACLQQSKNESEKWFLLVENEGESPLNVKILAPSSVEIVKSLKTVPLQQHERWKIGFHVDVAEAKIVLNAGNEDCNLDMLRPSAAVNFFQQLPSYANHVTPIYGVYLASFAVIFVGGTWACCKFRKRRRVEGGVAYQQLEMGTQQRSGARVDDNVIDGWDEGWNDDWDEEEAVPRPTEKRGSASENGVTFKSIDKNEWEDWDD